jgi:hypothetical protein
MSAAIRRPPSKPEPAASAAGPAATKIPAPIIDPNPKITASETFSLRASRVVGSDFESCAIVSVLVKRDLLIKRQTGLQ